jgi:hypothetical protein
MALRAYMYDYEDLFMFCLSASATATATVRLVAYKMIRKFAFTKRNIPLVRNGSLSLISLKEMLKEFPVPNGSRGE